MALSVQSKICLTQRNGLAVKVQRQSSMKPVGRTMVVTKALSDTSLIVGGALN